MTENQTRGLGFAFHYQYHKSTEDSALLSEGRA